MREQNLTAQLLLELGASCICKFRFVGAICVSVKSFAVYSICADESMDHFVIIRVQTRGNVTFNERGQPQAEERRNQKWWEMVEEAS